MLCLRYKEIGLKKKTEPPKKAEPKVLEHAQEKKEDKKTEDKKSGDKQQDGKNKNNKKKVAPEEKKSNIGVVVAIVVILALLGGGIWYKWEYVKSFFVKSGANQEVSTSVVVKPKTPVKPKVEQPPAPKRTYLEELQQLKTFIAQNPQKENEFLLDFDTFLKKYPLPQNTEERILFAEVVKIFNIIDERLRVEPRREILLKEHEREITLREEIIRQAEEAERQKKITEARIAEDARKKMELETARMTEELRLKEEENRIRAEYAQKLTPALDEMRGLFNLACRDISKKADLQNYVNKIRDKYPLRDYAITKELEVQNEVINIGKSLLANVDKANRMYKVFVGRDNKFIDLQFSKVVMLAVRDVNFENHNLRVEVLKNGKIHNYSLDKELRV